MKRIQTLQTVVRRDGHAFIWTVRDRIGESLEQGRSPNRTKAYIDALVAKKRILAAQPIFAEGSQRRSMQKRHSIWALRHAARGAVAAP